MYLWHIFNSTCESKNSSCLIEANQVLMDYSSSCYYVYVATNVQDRLQPQSVKKPKMVKVGYIGPFIVCVKNKFKNQPSVSLIRAQRVPYHYLLLK